jgi:hypothetical protein
MSRKNPQIWNFTKICSVEAELLHAEGDTDVTNLIVAFPNFSNEAKMKFYMSSYCRIPYLTAASQIKSYERQLRNLEFERRSVDLHECLFILKSQNTLCLANTTMRPSASLR